MAKYQDVETLYEGEVICLVTENEETRSRSFAFMKEYMHEGKPRRSNFLSRRHLPAVESILRRLAEHL